MSSCVSLIRGASASTYVASERATAREGVARRILFVRRERFLASRFFSGTEDYQIGCFLVALVKQGKT